MGKMQIKIWSEDYIFEKKIKHYFYSFYSNYFTIITAGLTTITVIK